MKAALKFYPFALCLLLIISWINNRQLAEAFNRKQSVKKADF